MLQEIIQENRLFQTFIMKDPDYVMNIKASSMTLDQLERSKTGYSALVQRRQIYLHTDINLDYILSIYIN